MGRSVRVVSVLLLTGGACVVSGCTPGSYRKQADKVAEEIIRQKQLQTFGQTQPFTIERPADTLRRRLMLAQELPHGSPAALSTRDLPLIKHWPKDDYLTRPTPADPLAELGQPQVLRLNLFEALQVAAQNSREYQARKEGIYLDALDLDLARDEFRPIFSGGISSTVFRDLSGDANSTGVVTEPQLRLDQRFTNGARVSLSIVQSLANLLTGTKSSASGLAADASIALPLLRGAGEYVVTEPLTQAERNVAYDLLGFEQFKRTFAVSIATQYLSVLQQYEFLKIAEDSYRRFIITAARSRAMAEAGQLPPFQLDQALSDELSARESWISAQASFARNLDAFKVLLGLPPDALIELDRDELRSIERLVEQVLRIAPPPESQPAVTTFPTTQPLSRTALIRKLEAMPKPSEVVLTPPNPADAGPYALPEPEAIQLALENRPDLRVVRGQVYDAQRKVTVAANALEAGLNLRATGSAGSRVGVASVDRPDPTFRLDQGVYTAGIDLDLPLYRTPERNAYRATLIALEQAVRAYQAEEDNIKLAVRNRLRDLLEARESLKTQSQAVVVAERRVASTNMLFEAGRVEIRDVLDAESSLTRAKNALTAALVDYRVAELSIQRDLGLLEVNHEGLWQEFDPRKVQTRDENAGGREQ